MCLLPSVEQARQMHDVVKLVFAQKIERTVQAILCERVVHLQFLLPIGAMRHQT